MQMVVLLLCPLVGGNADEPGAPVSITAPPDVKWSCLTSNVQVSGDVLSAATGRTVRVQGRIGTTEVSIIPMLARSAHAAGLTPDDYYYIGPNMAAVPFAKDLLTVFHVFCAGREQPQFQWAAATLRLDDGGLLHALTKHTFTGQNTEAPSHANHFLVFAEPGDNATNLTLSIPYSDRLAKGELKWQFRRERTGSQHPPAN